MITYELKQNKNGQNNGFGKWYAYPIITQTVELDGLAEHMASHNAIYSKGLIKGMLTDMCSCIKELLLDGKNVKIADLAIFSLGIKNKGGSNNEDEFTVTKHVAGVRLRARATGSLVTSNIDATLRKVSTGTKKASSGSASTGSEEQPAVETTP